MIFETFFELCFQGYFSQMDEPGVDGRVALVSRHTTSYHPGSQENIALGTFDSNSRRQEDT